MPLLVLRGLLAALCVLVWICPAAAGERLSLDVLAKRARAAARVRVDFESGRVEILEWLTPAEGVPAATPADWNGLCLPDRALTTKWLRAHAQMAARPLWKRALSEGGYSAIVFLAVRAGRLVPTCEAESMLALGWTSHPDFERYSSRARALLNEPERPPPPKR